MPSTRNTIAAAAALRQAATLMKTDTSPHEFQFSTGISATIKPVSSFEASFMRAAIARQYGKPAAPVEQTDLGEIPNESHPDYLAAVEKWKSDQHRRFILMLLRYAVTLRDEDGTEPSEETMARRVEVYKQGTADPVRAFLAAEGFDIAENGSDFDTEIFAYGDSPKIRYLYLVAANSVESEVGMLVDAVLETFNSMEVAIKAVEATF